MPSYQFNHTETTAEVRKDGEVVASGPMSTLLSGGLWAFLKAAELEGVDLHATWRNALAQTTDRNILTACFHASIRARAHDRTREIERQIVAAGFNPSQLMHALLPTEPSTINPADGAGPEAA